MRRLHVSTRAQVTMASVAGSGAVLSLFAAVNLAMGAPAIAGAVNTIVSQDAAVARMNAQVASLEKEMAKIRVQAAAHARRLEARQAILDAALTGKGDPTAMPAAEPAKSPNLSAVIAPFNPVESHQNKLVARAMALTNARYQQTAAIINHLGLAGRFTQVAGAMGGPLEPAGAIEMVTQAPKGQADPQFRALFQSWKRLETLQRGIVAIPSQRPVDAVTFTSGFGVRSDPFKGGAAMHAGVDIPGPSGTPVYATADGIVGRAQWANGYGNLVELEHGRGIQTRYGHLSAILVAAGTRVQRGQLIARMGSTGRSTGPHLHYEVRLDGHAVNPMPFLQSANYLTAMQKRSGQNIALGGPND